MEDGMATRALAVLIALVSLCADVHLHAQPPAALAGVWATDGYGYVLEIAGDMLRAFEVTSVSCLPAYTARAGTAPSGALGAFTRPDAPVTFIIRPDTAATRARLHVPGTASDRIIRRIDR